MASETFDQRFKRLTSEMLMLDICRALGIEVRDLMKIRAGVRVQLSSDRLRRLCREQGLDYPSFVRDIDSPWSSELKPATVITSDGPAAPAEIPANAAKAAKSQPAEAPTPLAVASNAPKFRPDGSRIVESPPAAAVFEEPPQRLSRLQIVSGSSPAAPQLVSGVVEKIRSVMASAASKLTGEYLPGRGDDLIIEDEHDDASERESAPAGSYHEPKKLAADALQGGDHAVVQSLIAEVSGLRREVKALSSRLDSLSGR